MNRKETLDEAAKCILQDRNTAYGGPERNFADIAKLWEIFTGYRFTPAQVGIMCGLIKIARMRQSPEKADHYIDLCGYAACAAECATENLEPEQAPGLGPAEIAAVENHANYQTAFRILEKVSNAAQNRE